MKCQSAALHLDQHMYILYNTQTMALKDIYFHIFEKQRERDRDRGRVSGLFHPGSKCQCLQQPELGQDEPRARICPMNGSSPRMEVVICYLSEHQQGAGAEAEARMDPRLDDMDAK